MKRISIRISIATIAMGFQGKKLINNHMVFYYFILFIVFVISHACWEIRRTAYDATIKILELLRCLLKLFQFTKSTLLDKLMKSEKNGDHCGTAFWVYFSCQGFWNLLLEEVQHCDYYGNFLQTGMFF